MAAIGLFVLRMLIARPLVSRVPGTSLRAVSIAFGDRVGARAARRPDLRRCSRPRSSRCARLVDLGALFPLAARLGLRPRLPRPRARASRSSSSAGCVAIWLDRPERAQRSIAEPARARGRAGRRGRVPCSCPAWPGTPGRPRRAAWRCAFDWLHLVAGLGLDRRPDRPARALCEPAGRAPGRRPRRLRSALLERRVRVRARPDRRRASARRCCTCRRSPRSGRPPTGKRSSSRSRCSRLRCCSRRSTCCARCRASRPRASAPSSARAAASLLAPARRAARRCSSPARSSPLRVLTSLAAALEGARRRSARPRRTSARAPVDKIVSEDGYTARVRVDAEPRSRAEPVRGCGHAGRQAGAGTPTSPRPSRCSTWRWASRPITCPRPAPGVYGRAAPALVMVGHWGLTFEIAPPGQKPFTVLVVDKATG